MMNMLNWNKMKNLIAILLIGCFFNLNAQQDAGHAAKKDSTSAKIKHRPNITPVSCTRRFISSKPGNCPKCGMTLIKKKN
jgi:hypothetical protein